jgi:8-oxo-dGTP pyrophosphatase MutT (NUDIX family)
MDQAIVQPHQPIVTREALVQALKYYRTSYAEEAAFVQDFLTLLLHPDAYQRFHLPGHVTGSAFIVDTNKEFALLTHHAKLNRWLQPGGHADGDENILRVALREAEEETGLTNLHQLTPGVFDLDIHIIPARKDSPEHLHYDVRFMFVSDRKEKILISEESHDLQWIALQDFATTTGNNLSMMRMAEKARNGF